MARVKQTARKGPAKKKSGADKRRSPRIAAQNELEDYDDTPAEDAPDADYRQTPAKTRSDTTLEKRDDAEQTAAEAADCGGQWFWSDLLKKENHAGGALEVYIGNKRGSKARKDDDALPCDPFSAFGYKPGWDPRVDDHPNYVEQKYRKAGFPWDHAASRAKIDALALECQKLDLCMPVPGNQYMFVQWVEWLLWQASKATPARRLALRASAKTVVGLATDAYVAMSAIADEQGPPDCCDGCAVEAIGLLENHPEIDEITLGGLVVTRDGRGGLCGNQNNYFTAPSCRIIAGTSTPSSTRRVDDVATTVYPSHASIRTGGGYDIDNTNLNQKLYADHMALCCEGPRCWCCNHCNTKIHAQGDEHDDDGFVSLFEREHANINNNHVF